MKSLALQWTNVFEEIREDRVNGNVAFTRMVVGRKCKFSRVVNGGGYSLRRSVHTAMENLNR
eukprot:jgi/Psemu1/304248/fgenesh1_kg.142_\